MGASLDRMTSVVTFILMTLAYFACEIASHLDGHMRPFGVVFGVVLLVIAMVAYRFVPHPLPGQTSPPRSWSWPLGVLLILPMLVEPGIRQWTNHGFPLDLQMVNGLRIFGLMLCALAAWPIVRRITGVVALFLALFASAMGDQPQIPFVLVPFALVGGIWLILTYRAEQSRIADAIFERSIERVSLRWPYRDVIILGVLAMAAVSLVVAGPKRVMWTLGEWLPTSGGSGATDPLARMGIGDGPEETAGPNARAAGMVETDKMIEDNRNSLIDAINDLYGPPHKPNKDRERMVASGLAEVIPNHGRLPDNRRPSREFETGRQGPKRDIAAKSQAARGILEVEGRTPLHLRVVAYEIFDVTAQRWLEGRKPSSRMFEAVGGDWMALMNHRGGTWYGADETHRIKIADLKDNLVPTPALTHRFRINKVDREDYYEWDYDGVLAFAGRTKMPQGVVVVSESRTLDRDTLDGMAIYAHGPDNLRQCDDDVIRQLAEAWAGDCPRGWPQIDAIRSRLKSHYRLDPAAVAPSGHASPVRWFLTESQAGPDYLFAGAAALLLRSLDYPTRICLGYYASPDAYDRETAHTPVRKSDLHVWPEVQLADQHWLVVEPTPGYETLGRMQTWREWFAERANRLAAWLQRHVVGVVLGSLGLLAVIVGRCRILDALITAWYRVFPGRSWQERIIRAMRLIDRRSMWAGDPRPPHQTFSSWAIGRRELAWAEFARLTDQAVYAPDRPPPYPQDQIASLCDSALAKATQTRLRRPTPETTSR